jgi:serine/threonine protein kinase
MSSEIPNGSILEKRYQIIKTLGRGGFGRAYLAIDFNRYNEQCVLKEFAPDIESQYWDKAKELFDRECSELYRLQHDQIPGFRELLQTKFKNQLYVFLAQNYVRGINYHAIVNKYGVLNEGQIIYFLQQILPVLSYIHDRGLIHRDISPDNIICRIEDQKPVLIDFGLVKDISAKYTQVALTRAGKPWFSPHEQLGGHGISPSSDLYALAVTVLFLLTNRNSSDFYTPRSAKWEFSKDVNISAGLMKILLKMLEHRPIDRYQTAAEVSRAIAILPQINPVPIPIDPQDLDSTTIPNQGGNNAQKSSSITTSMLELFRKADIWGRIKSDSAKPIKYVGGAALALFGSIVVLNWIVQGIGSIISSITRPQASSTPTPSIASSPNNSNSCLNIIDRLKTAKKLPQDVDKIFYRKYPDRLNKRLDPNNASDKKLMDEWCQIAEGLVKNQ